MERIAPHIPLGWPEHDLIPTEGAWHYVSPTNRLDGPPDGTWVPADSDPHAVAMSVGLAVGEHQTPEDLNVIDQVGLAEMADEDHYRPLREPGPDPPASPPRDLDLPDTPEREPDGPRIYVASLTDYNAGVLHGAWIPVGSDPKPIYQRIAEMLAASPTATRHSEVAEEWRIDDYERWLGVEIGEYESIETLAKLAAGLDAHGPAFGAWIQNRGDTNDETINGFDEHYLGEFSSVSQHVEELFDSLGVNLDHIDVPEWLANYISIDVDAFARDLELGGEISTVEGPTGVFIFQN